MTFRIGSSLLAAALLSGLLGTGCGAGSGESDSGDPGSDSAAVIDSSTDSGGGTDAATVTDSSNPLPDLDGDGIEDAQEQLLAEAYLPYLSIHPTDSCPTMGIVYRLRPHPADAAKILVVYDMLFDNDCGAGGHPGDNEVFAITVDPALPPPAGIVAIRAISHQGTPCQEITDCGCAAGGLTPCETGDMGGVAWPVVYTSENKHGSYLFDGVCDNACFFTNYCELGPPVTPMLINAGEPGAPLVNDLTAAGLITVANGWTHMELFDFDPWTPGDFGSAGDVSDDLVDPAFETPVPSCGP